MGFILSFFLISMNLEAKPITFGGAKTQLKNQVYLSKNKTFYCGCEYQKNSIKTQSCKLTINRYKKRQTRLEWEHVVPVAAFGHSFKEYRENKNLCQIKGKEPLASRKCASKLNSLFREMEGNTHNIVPTVGAINAIRSGYSFSDLNNKGQILCDQGMRVFERKVEPPLERKGDIARIYFYMDKKYPNRGILSANRRQLFLQWSILDPVSLDECRVNELKSKIQGEDNEFVTRACSLAFKKD